MTVSALKTRVSYTGDGAQKDFAFDMLINKDADLYVYLDKVKQTTGYSVFGGKTEAGKVQFTAAPNSGVVIDIVRVPDWLQELNLIVGGLNPESLESGLDHIVHLLQHIKDRLDRSLMFGLLSSTTEKELPEPQANMAIGYDSSGNLANLVATFIASGAFKTDCSLPFEKTAYFDEEIDNGNSGAADTIDWTKGNKQKSTLTNNCTFTFVAPAGPCNLILKLVQDATGNRTVTWPASVIWPAKTAPTLSTGANAIDVIGIYYDGTNYFGIASLDFG